MEKQRLLIRFPNQEMTAREYIAFCKHILHAFQQFAPDMATVGIWSLAKKADFYFDKKMPDFEDIILKEMQIEGKEYAFINENKEDKGLHLDSKSYGNFAFNFGLSNNGDESKEISISIWAGDKSKIGLLNVGFRNKLQPNLNLSNLLKLLEFNIDLVHPYYAIISSFKFTEKINKEENDIEIGWITYISHKEVVNLLPKNVERKVLPNGGVIFWLSEEKALSTDEIAVQKAIEIRDILGARKLLNYQSQG